MNYKRFIKRTVTLAIGVKNMKILEDGIHRIFNTNVFRENIEFEKRSIVFYSKLINDGSLCFDVGANFGNRISTFLCLNAKVVAIEPQKCCYNYLEKKFGNQIVLITKALGEKPGKTPMYISDKSIVSSLSEDWINTVKKDRFKDITWGKKVEVELTTLDELINKYGTPSFIKIDVEGYKLEVLKGLSKPVNLISFEYTTPEMTDKAIDCIKVIEKIDGAIECNYSAGESMLFEFKDWRSVDQFIQIMQTDKFISSRAGDIYIRRIKN